MGLEAYSFTSSSIITIRLGHMNGAGDKSVLRRLAIEDIPSSGEEDDLDVDSLFDSASPLENYFPLLRNTTSSSTPSNSHSGEELSTPVCAQITAPSIPGLYYNPSVLLSEAMSSNLMAHAYHYFRPESWGSTSANSTTAERVNQAMLFGKTSAQHGSGLPPFLDDLITTLASLLKPHLPEDIHELLFVATTTSLSPDKLPLQTQSSRQAILNHYAPGEGITPHVDLLQRFGDGIIGVSLGSGTVMTFRRIVEDDEEQQEGDRQDLYLPPRSIIVLTRDARYKWAHGIDGRYGDYVFLDETEKSWIERGTRVSITLRWLLPGADIVGQE